MQAPRLRLLGPAGGSLASGPALVLLLALAGACTPDDGGTGSASGEPDRGRRPGSETDAGDDSGDGLDTHTGDDTGASDGDASPMPDVDPPPDLGGGDTCGIGRIEGRVCAPSEHVWIGGADVVLTGTDCDGNPFELETVSDSDGYFTFGQVASGFHTLRISKGSFQSEMNVMVRADEVTDLVAGGEKACLDDRDIRIAVVTGSYDSIEEILRALGVEHDVYSDFSLFNA
jgi:hypothetical protein